MARPTAMDEQFVHQIPELLPDVAMRSPHWRESYFFELHRPTPRGTRCSSPWRTSRRGRSWIRSRWDGSTALRCSGRQPALRRRPSHDRRRRRGVEIVRPFEEIRLTADPEVAVRVAGLVGMAAMFSGASHALLTSIIFAFGRPGSRSASCRSSVAAAPHLVSILLMRHSIMTERLARRGAPVPTEYSVDYLRQQLVRDHASTEVMTIRSDNGRSGAGAGVGSVRRADAQRLSGGGRQGRARRRCDAPGLTIRGSRAASPWARPSSGRPWRSIRIIRCGRPRTTWCVRRWAACR